MTRNNPRRGGGAASSCPALVLLRGTLGHQDDNPRKPRREPAHLFNADGICRHCGDRRPT